MSDVPSQKPPPPVEGAGAEQSTTGAAAGSTSPTNMLQAAIERRHAIMEAFEIQRAQVYEAITEQKLAALRQLANVRSSINAEVGTPDSLRTQQAAASSKGDEAEAPSARSTAREPVVEELMSAMNVFAALQGAAGEAAALERNKAAARFVEALRNLVAQEVARRLD